MVMGAGALYIAPEVLEFEGAVWSFLSSHPRPASADARAESLQVPFDFKNLAVTCCSWER